MAIPEFPGEECIWRCVLQTAVDKAPIRDLFPRPSEDSPDIFSVSDLAIRYPVAAYLSPNQGLESRLKRFSGWHLSAVDRIRRVLLLFRLALASELELKLGKADFFWPAAHRELKAIDPTAWKTAAAQLPCRGQSAASAEFLKQAVIHEVFVHTHLAIFRTLAGENNCEGRASLHLDYATELLKFSPGCPQTLDALRAVLHDRIGRDIGEKKWAAAIKYGERLVESCPAAPESVLDLARAHYLKTIEEATEFDGKLRATVLRPAANELERLQTLSPHSLPILLWAANLYVLYATALRTTIEGFPDLPEALLAVVKALHLNPQLGLAAELEERLRAEIASLQAEVGAVVDSMPSDHQLSRTGVILKRYAEIGVAPAAEFLASAQAAQLLNDYAIAAAQSPVADAATGQLPAKLRRSSGKASRRGLPLLFWIWSPDDKRIKLQAIAAMILLVFACAVGVIQHSHRSIRDASYARLTDSMAHGNFAQAITEAETFLSASVLAADSREPMVTRLYSEGLVRWFSTQPEESRELTEHLQRYHSLVPQQEEKR
jgi:hypothetical protein